MILTLDIEQKNGNNSQKIPVIQYQTHNEYWPELLFD